MKVFFIVELVERPLVQEAWVATKALGGVGIKLDWVEGGLVVVVILGNCFVLDFRLLVTEVDWYTI